MINNTGIQYAKSILQFEFIMSMTNHLLFSPKTYLNTHLSLTNNEKLVLVFIQTILLLNFKIKTF